jgi:hypothetical protein
MVQRKLTIPERWQAVGMHNGGFSHRRVADHFRINHSIIVRLMQRFRQTENVTDRPRNVQVQLTVKGKTTPDSYTPTPKSSCAQNVVVLK